MTNKEKYVELCKSKGLNLYMQYWWLDLVCIAGNWGVSLVENQEGIIAAFPYYMVKKFGIEQIVMPPYTQTLGPWISNEYLETKPINKRQAETQNIIQELLRLTPKVGRFSYNIDSNIVNGLPFYWAGFQQTVRYTQIVNSNNYILNSVAKRKINSAEKNKVIVKKGEYNIAFIDLINELNRIKATGQDLELIESIYEGVEKRGGLNHLSAFDVSGNLLGSIVLFLDTKKAYILIDLATRKVPNHGAQYLLYKKALDFCKEQGFLLDFEGSMIKEIEQRNRYFGAELTPYFSIMRYKTKFHEFLFRIRNK